MATMFYPHTMANQGLRTGLATLTLVTGALFSHHLAGGTFIAPSRLLIETLFFLAAIFSVRKLQFDGPALALLVVLAHSTSHFLLGSNTSPSSTSLMAGAHILGGVVTYLVIQELDRFWQGAITLWEYLFNLIEFRPLVLILKGMQLDADHVLSFSSVLSRSVLHLRAPPVGAA